MASVLKVDTIKSLTGNEAMTIHESGVPLLQVPAFKYIQGTQQNNVGSSALKVNVDTKIFNTHDSWFDTTNCRYVPQIAGYYSFTASVFLQLTTSVGGQHIQIRKNGALVARQIFRDTATTTYNIQCSGITYMNGSTDYVECWGVGVATTVNFYSTGDEATAGSLEGFLVRPT